MGFLHYSNLGISINPPPSSGMQIGILHSSSPLSLSGLNFPVTISTANTYLQSPNFDKTLAFSMTVMAHLDTGASMTSIDTKLAKHLKLFPTSISKSHTAGGLITVPNFAVNLSFPTTNLMSFTNLPISSCNLPFDFKGNMNDPKNFAVLIGRDILSRWNVVWNGPTSTVFIND